MSLDRLTIRTMSDLARQRQQEVTTPLILRKHGDQATQLRIGRLHEYGDGSFSDGIVHFQAAQIPTYFRTLTANDRRRLARFNDRVRQLETERAAFMNEAWTRGMPLATGAAQAAARKRKKTTSHG